MKSAIAGNLVGFILCLTVVCWYSRVYSDPWLIVVYVGGVAIAPLIMLVRHFTR